MTWNNCFHLPLGNTSGRAKQHNQHSWLFNPLVPLTSPGVLVDSHSQQPTGKPKLVWFHHQSPSWARSHLPLCWKSDSRGKLMAQGQQGNNQSLAAVSLLLLDSLSVTTLTAGTKQKYRNITCIQIQFCGSILLQLAVPTGRQKPSIKKVKASMQAWQQKKE